ncbi:YceI family protein [Coralloluteibacterium thermophilus]|uniref:YceI family protein n=1 Tax=Coralloluteibacterium thermophilum TaxID=2707049 RepID=A0ABV9NI85_9GAMM
MRGLLLLLLLTTVSPLRAEARYAIDPVHTRIAVLVGHSHFSRAIGTLSGTQGSIRYDARHPERAQVDARIPLARLDFGDADWNAAVAARGLLDVERAPVARFVSTAVEILDGERLRIHGDLTLAGTTRPTVLEARINALRRHPMPPFRRTLGVSARTVLDRRDFGVAGFPRTVGHEVEVLIELEAARTGDDGDDIHAEETQ